MSIFLDRTGQDKNVPDGLGQRPPPVRGQITLWTLRWTLAEHNTAAILDINPRPRYFSALPRPAQPDGQSIE